jgi:hypothetical protein
MHSTKLKSKVVSVAAGGWGVMERVFGHVTFPVYYYCGIDNEVAFYLHL